VRFDAHRKRRDMVRLELPHRWRGAPVDNAARQMPDEIEDERAGETLEQLCYLRADAGEHRYWRKQLVEDGGTHKRCLYRREGYRQGHTT
jgi:hypothetical protein